MILLDKGENIDILMISEGTYPYVRGGVSTWIEQIIKNMPEYSFGILFLGSRPEDYEGIQYEFPENLIYLEDHYLFSEKISIKKKKLKGAEEVFCLGELLKDTATLDELKPLLEYDFYKRVSYRDFVSSLNSWIMFEQLYTEMNITIPFIDFFWTVINIFTPFWTLILAVDNIKNKNIKLIHSPSTGYAGFIGSFLKNIMNIPFLVTEHGMYTKERKIDILNAKWAELIKNVGKKKYRFDDLKRLWINFFINLGKISYLSADRIFSLFEQARKSQIILGAPINKTRIIPNGVNIEQDKSYLNRKDNNIPRIIALIGRVVSIKDIKTFIKAIRVVREKMPDIQGWIVGPEDEDPQYVYECKMLVEILELKENIKFLGYRKVQDIFPQVGLVTLTSISEGMPLIILEAFSNGVPCVATDVGACRQLIYGGINQEDIDIGKAGEVVSVGDVSALAESYCDILSNPEKWNNYSVSGRKRVEKYYSLDRIIDSYRVQYSYFIGN